MLDLPVRIPTASYVAPFLTLSTLEGALLSLLLTDWARWGWGLLFPHNSYEISKYNIFGSAGVSMYDIWVSGGQGV